MQGDHWICDTEEKFRNLIRELEKDWNEHHYILAQWKIGKQRSSQQNKALHVYCKMLAQALNDAGLDMRAVLKPDVEIPWTGDAVKECLWRPIQKAVLGKESTKEPHRDEYPQVYDVLNRHISTKFGVSVEWPCKERKVA